MQPKYEALFAQNQFLTQQLNVALLEIQKIKLEITQLKAENAHLKAENAHLKAENADLKAENAELKAENGKLKTEIKELNEKLNTNSTNSSTPPSQDPFRKTKKKKKTGCKQGAQSGHNGHRRDLYPLEQVQEMHDLRPTFCPNCESKEFHQEAISTDTRQVIELPDTPSQITQFNIHTCQCTCCGKRVKADVPPEAKYGFGPRLMGFITSLSGEFRLSKRQVVALVGKIGIRMCSGSVCKIHERASRILSTPYQEVKQHTLKQNISMRMRQAGELFQRSVGVGLAGDKIACSLRLQNVEVLKPLRMH
jgi:regulator of replication initiation timing